MQNTISTLCILCAVILTGCGGNQTVTRMSSTAPEAIRTVAISPQAGNTPEVDRYISKAFISKGIVVSPQLPLGAMKSDSVDAVVSYTDLWRWDITTYLDSILVYIYNAKTGELLVSGRWRDSYMHAYHRGENITKELIDAMLAKLNIKESKELKPSN